MNTIRCEYTLGDMRIRYISDEDNKVQMELVPEVMAGDTKPSGGKISSLCQIHIRGEDYPAGFSTGHTMHNSPSANGFTYANHVVNEDEEEIKITMMLQNKKGIAAEQIVVFRKNTSALKIHTICRNQSENPVTLDLLSSFSIGGISPFREGIGENALVIHRLRSHWSDEGRLESIPAENFQLEPSWANFSSRVEKYGQIGSMPVRQFFPFAAVEDCLAGVVWAAQIACPSSWQFEFFREDSKLHLCGGLADRDFGHWSKSISPGESFETPVVFLTAAAGDFETTAQRLLTLHEKTWSDELPVVFNEYCTTWGNPSHENVLAIVDKVKDLPIDYFVIDAGWYMDENNNWSSNGGDWVISPKLFPDGMMKTTDVIRNAGMKPGIWFEAETCAPHSDIYQDTDMLLHRDGFPLTVGPRRFLDMRKDKVQQRLDSKIIDLLRDYGFSYMKVDYNECVGAGCDGAESPGEGLRQNAEAARDFYKRVKSLLPGMILENCASGGHRLEPSLLSIFDMASFSDAHECKEIPIIAANLHYVMQPSKSQIWAVLHKEDSLKRIVYSIINTFLGVMCLSGDIPNLDRDQWDLMERGVTFYKKISPVISSGTTKITSEGVTSWRKPTGFQVVQRHSADKDKMLVIVHSFAGFFPENITVPVTDEYELDEVFSLDQDVVLENGSLCIKSMSDFSAVAVCLKKVLKFSC